MIEMVFICGTVLAVAFIICKAAVDICLNECDTKLELESQKRRNAINEFETLKKQVDEHSVGLFNMETIPNRMAGLEESFRTLDGIVEQLDSEVTELKTKTNGESLKDGLKLK